MSQADRPDNSAQLNSPSYRLPALDQDFLLNNTLVASAVTWSACGEDVILRTNSSMRVQTRGGADAMATVDSQDVNAALVYHLAWRRC